MQTNFVLSFLVESTRGGLHNSVGLNLNIKPNCTFMNAFLVPGQKEVDHKLVKLLL